MSLTDIVLRAQFIIHYKCGVVIDVTDGRHISVSYRDHSKHSIVIGRDGVMEHHVFNSVEFFKDQLHSEELKGIVREYKLKQLLQ
jgi:hypothetical protein